MKKRKYVKRVKQLRKLIEEGRCSASYSASERDMYNGMIFALAIIDRIEPQFNRVPEVWGCDLPNALPETDEEIYN